MVWGLASVALLAFMVSFITRSPGLMGLCLSVGFVCALAAALIFIDRHVRASSRPEHMTERELEALRTAVHKQPESPRQLPPSRAD